MSVAYYRDTDGTFKELSSLSVVGMGNAETEQQKYEEGKKEIWKGITDDGTRERYVNAFQYHNLEYFYPYYNLQPIQAGYMFAQTNGGVYIDLVDRFEQFGTTLDFSLCASLPRTFYYSAVTRIGVIDCRSATSLEYIVSNASQLHTIVKMIVDADNTYNNSFVGTSALENIEFEGEIGNNINFASCTKLTHDSLMSIINHLQAKTSGTFTITLGSTNTAKLTTDELNSIEEKGWQYA